MTTDLTTLGNSLPAELREQFAAEVSADLARLGSMVGKDTIRVTQDKKFQFPDDTFVDTPLELVIVDFVYRNEYYKTAFNRKELVAPTCFAVSAEAVNIQPTPRSPEMQVEPGQLCRDCRWDKFGSSPQGDGKACKNTVYMAVLPDNATSESPMFVIKTSPTAIRPFNQYVAKVGRTVNMPVWSVLTKIYFDPAASFASLRFDLAGPNAAVDVTRQRREEARFRLMQEPDFSSAEK